MSEGDLFDNLPEPDAEKTALQTPREPIDIPPRREPDSDEPFSQPVTTDVWEDKRSDEDTSETPDTDNDADSRGDRPEDDAPPPPPAPRRTTPLPPADTLGQTLAKLRLGRGLELDDVAEETKIKAAYIKALEEDAFSELPHMVYALAYVKKLCALYNVSDADADELLSVLREQLAYEIPEDIDKSVICREQDEETRRKLHQISVALVSAVVLFAMLLVIAVVTLLLRIRSNRDRSGTQNGIEEQLSEDWLARHRKPQKLKSSKIELQPYRNQRGNSRRR